MSKIREEKIYIYMALIFGLLFIFITPPFQSPDEDTHFIKSYLVSKGKFYPTTKNNNYGNNLPVEMKTYINKQLKYFGRLEKKYTFQEMVSDQYNKMDYQKEKFYTYSTSKIIPVAYAAPATGIIFSKIIAKVFLMENISTTYMLYFARLFSLFLSVFITYQAIKKTPIYKKTMLCVALIPMATFLTSVVSYDNLLLPISLYAIATILKLKYDKKEEFNWKNIFSLGIIGVILLNVKTVYFLIFGLMILIPKEKYGNKKETLKKIGILLLIVLGITILLKLPFSGMPIKANTESKLASKQISFILNNPFKYTGILINNILMQRGFQLNTMIGVFGLIDTYMPIAIVSVILIFLIIIAISEGSTERIKISIRMKIVLTLIILGIVCLVYTAMYIYWTPLVVNESIGGNEISGVQGRYFLPILFPFLLLFSNKLSKNNKLITSIQNNYILIPISSLVISAFMLVLRYWV